MGRTRYVVPSPAPPRQANATIPLGREGCNERLADAHPSPLAARHHACVPAGERIVELAIPLVQSANAAISAVLAVRFLINTAAWLWRRVANVRPGAGPTRELAIQVSEAPEILLARLMILFSSRSQRTELAAARQRSQSLALKLVVEKACCRNGT